jgi:hypothetical protein
MNTKSKLIKIKDNKLNIDKHSIQYLKYKDIALEFIKQGYNNIRTIYSKYYPEASEDTVDVNAYVLLDNARFQAALEDAWSEVKIEDLDIARVVAHTLQNIAINGKKEADRIAAASWLGKTKALFIDKSEAKSEVSIADKQAQNEHINSRLKELGILQ